MLLPTNLKDFHHSSPAISNSSILLFPLLLLPSINATSLKEAVESALAKNPEVQSIQENTKAYRYYIDEEEAGYYPTINLDVFVESKKETKDPKEGDTTKINKILNYN